MLDIPLLCWLLYSYVVSRFTVILLVVDVCKLWPSLSCTAASIFLELL